MFTINSLGWLHLKTITKTPAGRTKYLDMLYQALKTIKPTSVEADRAFSAMVFFFATKIRNRMGDKTLDALVTMQQCYKKLRKVEEPTSDD